VDGNLTRAALARGYAAVLWTISSADTRSIDADTIARNVIYTPNPGDIVLMHDGAGHQATADAVPRILRELGEAGFKFVTMPELLRAWDIWQAEQ
jgi:peptidoglycan/xylan/chitin deacetylase (PgdA/CDA1 family)